MNDYLVKPFDVFTLSKILDKVIKTSGGESHRYRCSIYQGFVATIVNITCFIDALMVSKLGFKSRIEPSNY